MPIEFAYAQARIQARSGQRLTPGAWQSLEASQGFSHYLHAVRGTSLKGSVQHLAENADVHLIERSLREEWRGQVQQICTWVPGRWRAAVMWVRTLTDLSPLAYLLGEHPVLGWMRDDPTLQPVAAADVDARVQALSSTELAPLAVSAGNDSTVGDAWLDHWRSLWPATPGELIGLDKLGKILGEHQHTMQGERVTVADVAGQREGFERQLLRAIRIYRELPVALFSFLGLLASDLRRLRGGLIQRALFSTVARE